MDADYEFAVHSISQQDRNWCAFVSTARAQENHREVDKIDSQSRKKSLKPRRGRPAKPKVEHQEL